MSQRKNKASFHSDDHTDALFVRFLIGWGLLIGVPLLLFNFITGCEPRASAETPTDASPTFSILGGGLELHALLEDEEGTRLELSFGADGTSIKGVKSWRLLKLDARAHLDVYAFGNEHAAELQAESEGEWPPCLLGSYELGAMVLSGEVPGTGCE